MIRVILADDEPHTIHMLKQQIPWEKWNLELIAVAADGRQLLREIEDKHPQIVISDIVMPIMTGLDVAAKIKDMYPEIHFILTSAYADFTYARTALKLGLDDLLPKPIIRAELYEALKKVLQELGLKPSDSPSEELQIIRKVKDYIHLHYEEKISLESAAAQIYLSPAYLSRLFKQETGQNFKDYLTQVRIEAAKRLLETECFNINQVSEMSGFGNSKYFSRIFHEVTGQTPSEYKNSH